MPSPLNRLVRPLLVAFLALAGIAAPATAQFGQAAGFGEVMSPYFLRRDLNTFVEKLQLDQGQGLVVENLFFDYEDAHNASKARMLESIGAMREQLQNLERDQMLRLVFAPFEEKAEEWDRQRTEFLENVKLILNDRQQEMWPTFLRELRREKEILKGDLSGESVDLVSLARLHLPAPAQKAIAASLEDYAIDLDIALVEREKRFAEARLAMMHSIRDDDPDTALALYSKQVEARVEVRNANDRWIEIITSILAPEDAAVFRTEAFLRGYPRIFRPTAAQRIFTEAKELETISEETLAAIIDLETAFLTELAVINEDLVRQIRDYEPEDARYRAERFAARERGIVKPSPTDPTRESFAKRTAIDHRYMELLQSLLTKSEFASLPGASRFIKRDRSMMESDSADQSGGEGARQKKLDSRGRRPDGIGNAGRDG